MCGQRGCRRWADPRRAALGPFARPRAPGFPRHTGASPNEPPWRGSISPPGSSYASGKLLGSWHPGRGLFRRCGPDIGLAGVRAPAWPRPRPPAPPPRELACHRAPGTMARFRVDGAPFAKARGLFPKQPRATEGPLTSAGPRRGSSLCSPETPDRDGSRNAAYCHSGCHSGNLGRRRSESPVQGSGESPERAHRGSTTARF
jgi:hypothetical protein